ncbi:hypothetical protein HZB97_03935, partial [Candidatus Gottesmanbacteria bacterium]|nr:hypothetical protein [Candidatus Gottesmanbacteria bacterium]
MENQRERLRLFLETDLETANYFLDREELDWEDAYRGIEKHSWLTYFQVRYPKKELVEGKEKIAYHSLSNWQEFLQAICQEIQLEIDNLSAKPPAVEIPPTIPPNLAELVERWEEQRRQGIPDKKIKKNLLTNIEATQKALYDQWEIQRQEVLRESTIIPAQQTYQQEIKKQTESILTSFAVKA